MLASNLASAVHRRRSCNRWYGCALTFAPARGIAGLFARGILK